MTIFRPILVLTLALHVASAAQEAESVVRFTNNDRIPGSLESLSSEILVWKSPVLVAPTPFHLKNVVDLTLPASSRTPEKDHEAILTLTNGDTVHGQLSAVSDQTVTLDTWYAGRLEFNRLMVSDLRIEPKSALLYRGPDSLDGWIQPGESSAWTYARSALRSHGAGSIGRDGLLPEECSIRFDAAWKADSFSFKVVLFSEDPATEEAPSGYEISFQRGSVYLRNRKTHGFLGSARAQPLLENDKVRVEIRASRKSGKVCLYVDDEIVEVWSDPDVARGSFGSGLQFESPDTSPLRISRIEVADWDGIVDKMPEPRVGMLRRFGIRGHEDEIPPEPEEKPAAGRMELANGDTIAGEVTSIKDGVISVKTPLAEIQIPVSRLRTVALKPVEAERCIRREGDIRAWFPDGSSIVFRLDEVGDGTLTGSSQNFGSATFKMDAFNRLEFNIYPWLLDERPVADDW